MICYIISLTPQKLQKHKYYVCDHNLSSQKERH